MDYPPIVLSRWRKTATATAASLPATIAHGNVGLLTVTFASVLKDVAAMSHTWVRVSVFASSLATDAGGAPFIGVQSVNMTTNGATVGQPLYTGSSQGLFNGSSLQGSLVFDTDDLPTAPTGVVISAIVNNSDSVDHQVTGFTATVLIEATQYADSYLATVQ